MKNIKISTKLIALVAFLSAIIIVIGVYGLNSIEKINKGLDDMYHNRVEPLQYLKKVSDAYAVSFVDVAHKAEAGTMSWPEALRELDKATEVVTKNWNAYAETKMEGREKELADEAVELRKVSKAAYNKIYDILSQGKDSATQAALTQFVEHEMYEAVDPYTAIIDELVDLQLTYSEEIDNNAKQLFDKTQRNSYFIIAFGLLLGIIISIYIIVGINKSIKQANYVISELSEGNLKVKITVTGNDEIGRLLRNLSTMVDKLKEVLAYVRDAASNIASASQQLSQGSTEQASSTEEVSSSVEEMSANIQQNTDNSQQTEKIAKKAATDIRDGNQSVTTTVDAMRQIAEKISIIGEIARKTDLLAINAAIEAARAGEHGKGFAVVASEVRKLAERSQLAAQEIDDLSKNSVDVAEKSGKLLSEIVPDIQNTAKLVQEITASSIEQNSGTDQINSAVQQLNQVTQQNAAAAEELSTQADQLQDSVSFFKIDQSTLNEVGRKHKKINISRVQANNQQNTSGVNLKMDAHDDEDKNYENF